MLVEANHSMTAREPRVRRSVRIRYWLACATGLLALNREAAAAAMHMIEPFGGLGVVWSPDAMPPGSTQGTSAEAVIGFAGSALVSGAPSEAGSATVPSAQFLGSELVGFEVDYPAIKLRNALRADHVLLRHGSDRAESAGTRDLLNAAILALTSEIVSRQNPR
jgi:hypothetical protein